MAQLSNKYIQTVEKEAYIVYNSAGFSGDSLYDARVNPNLAQRIPQNRICHLANNRFWQSGYNFTPYNLYDSSNSYFFNPINNTVYLLLSKGPNNRTDEWSQYLSTVLPTHQTGIQTTSDNHTWIAFYKVPENKLDFIDTANLPIPLTFYPEDNYTSFIDKYEISCGEGVTTFGCCCLYYTEYEQDKITGEIYNIGDVTNQTIFSECYECQQLAETLNKEFIFLAGQTAGNVKSSETGENPLCPATKTINSLETILSNSLLSPTSYLYFQKTAINNFENNLGIASITLDFTNLNPDDFKMTVENPELSIIDPTGTGAKAKIKTYKKIINGIVYHIPYGIDLISRGANYSFPDIRIEGLGTSHSASSIYNFIIITQFPTDFLTNVSKTIIPQRIAYENTISSSDLINYFNGANVKSVSLLLQPKTRDNASPNYTPNANTLVPLVDIAYLGLAGVAEEEQTIPELIDTTQVYFDDLSPYANASNNNYQVYLSHLTTDANGIVRYTNDAGEDVQITDGWKASLNDDSNSIKEGDTILLPNAVTKDPNDLKEYTIRKIQRATLNKLSGEIVSITNLSNSIDLASETTKTIKNRTFRITINTGN